MRCCEPGVRRESSSRRFLGSLRRPAAGQRDLFVEHALLPHGPSRFLPSGREYRPVANPDALRDEQRRWLESPLLVDQALQHHLLQVGYVDTLVGALLRRLKAVGLYDRALVVVVADHGISFEPGGSGPRGDQGEHRGHRRRPALREVPGAASRDCRPARRRDDRRRPDDRRRDRRTDPLARRRTIAPRLTCRPAGHRQQRLRAGLDVARCGRIRRACDRAAERGAVRPGPRLAVPDRPAQGTARAGRRRTARRRRRARRRSARRSVDSSPTCGRGRCSSRP